MSDQRYPRISERSYPHGDGFRFRITEAPGVRTWGQASRDEAEARAFAEEHARGIQARLDLTVGGLIDRYLGWLRAMGRKPLTISAARDHLRKILGPLSHLESASVTVQRARARYMELATQPGPRKRRTLDQESLIRQESRALATSERWHVQRLSGRKVRSISDEAIRHRQAQIEVFAERSATGKIDRRQTDSPYLANLWRRLENWMQRRRKQAEEIPDRQEVTAAATHQIALGRARSAWKWAMRQGLVRSNPWLDVDKVGRMVKGKPQLRIDEARKLADVCMESVMVCDGALAIVLAQMMALRVSEVVLRNVRDADDNYRLLWVPDTKSPAGRRAPEIPGALREAVRSRCEGRPMDAPLIRTSAGKRPTNRWLGHMLTKYCKLAGIPVVCPHSLRGQWATIAVESGALTHAVAEALGHASFEVTAAHYAKPEAIERAAAKKRLRVLAGGKKG